MMPGVGDDRKLKVSRVVDGDTVVMTNGQKVRFPWVNAPETKTAKGPEVANYIRNKTEGKRVEMVYDTDRKGEYSREIADLLINGKSLSQMMVEDGVSKVSTYGANTAHGAELAKAQEKAEAQGKGFWGDANMKIKLKSDDLGKDPNMLQKLWYSDKGDHLPDLSKDDLDDYSDMTLEDAQKLAKKKGHKFDDEQLFRVRAAGDGYADFFVGGYKNPTKDFPTGKGVSFSDKLVNAYKATHGGNAKDKLHKIYTTDNYTDGEKEQLYSLMGFSEDEAARATLNKVKGEGMHEASPIIYSYLDSEGMTSNNVKLLIEDKTLTSPQIKDMYEQDFISDKEYDTMMNLYKTRNSWTATEKKTSTGGSVSGTGGTNTGTRTTNSGTRTSSGGTTSKKSTKTSNKKSKLTPYKFPTVDYSTEKMEDYFTDISKQLESITNSPKIKIKAPPKQKAFDVGFNPKSGEVPSIKKPAKIKVNWNTGLI